ncbi:post-transcriptional regulator [Niallia sp. 01092]|uniref:post-transcriptional regulator n=1 Tax=unclassified Niallia TaxID=2837522 RepID=UPI003FD0D854
MSSAHLYDHYRKELQPVLKSKLEEFHLLGYETITEDELWFYLTKKKWKKPSDSGRMFILVQDILHVKIGEFMNFTTIEAYKMEDFFSVLSEEEKKELLK